jgi:hypothetical protein
MTDCKLWTLEINIEGRQFFCLFILLNSVRVYWHLNAEQKAHSSSSLFLSYFLRS